MQEKYQETFNTWNKIAQLYEGIFMDLTLYNDTYTIFSEAIKKKDASILEIGCGPGNITQHLSKLLPDSNILATDVSQNMITLAQKNNPKATCAVMDCRNITQLDQQFDGIMCGFIIPYLSKNDCAKFITDCYNLLSENGILYLSFVAGKYTDSGFISGSTGDRAYFYYHELETIQTALQANNFQVFSSVEKEYIKSDGSVEIHTILNAKK
ncbi:class I SAM-dependent DNA methyltransferase [Kordia sp.]|uniref:class I SAM-dependent DNA methyltransferase n=1 Tax=Kordia sp. TaxID=1965332 RepID=UPI003D6BAC13